MQLDLALARQASLSRTAEQTANRALALWRARMGTNFDASWTAMSGELGSIAAAGQVAAAAGASAYLSRTARSDHITDPAAGDVQAGAYAGVDASGRTVDGLLYGSVITTKALVGSGAGLQQALLGGATHLATMMHTAVLDTGRSSDLTAMTSRGYTHYVRVITAGACSRCAILAGTGSAQTPFLRHPRCRCTAAPQREDGKVLKADRRFSSASEYFESMTPAEQDRIFTRAGAEAIRAGADEISVVTARRGAVGIDYSRAVLSGKTLPNSGRTLIRSVIGHDADGTAILGYTTGEGTTVRGAYAKQQREIAGKVQKVGDSRYRTAKRIRLMPETVIDLTDDVALRKVLLRDAGYLRYPTDGRDWIARRSALIRQDRATADAFYRDHGIRLG